MATSNADDLARRLAARVARVGVIGPTAGGSHLTGALVAAGFPVLMFRFDLESSPASLPPGTVVVAEPERMGEPDVLIVDTSILSTQAPRWDTAPLPAVFSTVARQLRPGQLVILTGAVPPGTTRMVALPILAASGLIAGRDFLLACSPDPEGTARRVVGGLDPANGEMACVLFGAVDPTIVRVSSPEAAEVCGAVRALTRVVHTAVANELKLTCDRTGVDIREVLATGLVGFPEFEPGPGGREPLAAGFAWGVRRYGASARLVELAVEVNAAMPAYVVSKVADALNDAGKPVKGSKVAILGMAYEKDVDDKRESPGFELADLLLAKGAIVSYNDPHITPMPTLGHSPHVPAMTSSPLTAEYLADQDCVLIAAGHSVYDYNFLVTHSKLVIDTNNATKNVTTGREKIVRT